MRLLIILFTFSMFACSSPSNVQKTKTLEQKIIDKSIAIHGGKLYKNAHYSFEFRDKKYTFKHQDARYEYTSDQSKNDRDVHYYLSNDQFINSINGEVLLLSDKDIIRYGNTLNSVIYFALLPYRLNDPAVIKSYKGITQVKDQAYHTIEVRFSEEKGGTDHEDVYYYWINQKTSTMDYFAYNFHVNGGGVRFRKAYNARMIDGLRFQDYENYSAAAETRHGDLPGMYERGELKLLSKIELENVLRIED
ncbi:MAG: hypothetical protein ACI8P3_004058 [Saprospiraceae bacterium]|jgi:hypothetical protein